MMKNSSCFEDKKEGEIVLLLLLLLPLVCQYFLKRISWDGSFWGLICQVDLEGEIGAASILEYIKITVYSRPGSFKNMY